METKYMTIGEIMAIPYAYKTVIIHNDDNTSEFSYEYREAGGVYAPNHSSKNCYRTDTRVKRTEILYGSHKIDEQDVTTIYYDADGNVLYGNFKKRRSDQKISVTTFYYKIEIKK